jgi:hypothetical protein
MRQPTDDGMVAMCETIIGREASPSLRRAALDCAKAMREERERNAAKAALEEEG